MCKTSLWEGIQAKDMTGTRITIVIDDKILLKLREVQANLIKETQSSWSFSKTITLVSSIGLGVKKFNPIIEKVIEEAKKDLENEILKEKKK